MPSIRRFGGQVQQFTNDDQLVQLFSDILTRREALETLGGGDLTTVSANPDPADQDEPIQGSLPFGSIKL